ncbi:hypothetical protein AAFC00_005891 [Neodothiora populina]|uniref:Serine aminopeptidase S33 domain-containing protein n=1 Tax=Neodothiora populina TaxID=2781224 RepID=A0ABR3P6C0_9PEZI
MPFLQVNYKRVYYKDWAPANGATAKGTIVMSHGLGSSNNYYTAVVPSLTEQGYRCICPDTTGSGLSPYSQVEQDVHSLASDVIALMDELKIEKATFVGHSMSGMTGPELAAEWPERITGMILVGPVWPSADVTKVFEARVDKVAEEGMDPMADTVPYAAVGSKAQRVHSAFIRELVLGMDPAGYISLCRVVAYAYKSPPQYAKVKCPTLIIAGDEDKSAPLPGCKNILENISSTDKNMTVLDGVGHWHCIEAPEKVGELMADFMKRH